MQLLMKSGKGKATTRELNRRKHRMPCRDLTDERSQARAQENAPYAFDFASRARAGATDLRMRFLGTREVQKCDIEVVLLPTPTDAKLKSAW